MEEEEEDSFQLENSRQYRCCCQLCQARTGCIVICIVEVLVAAHSIIAVIYGYVGDEVRYIRIYPQIASVIKYKYILAILVFQSSMLLSVFLTLFGIKALMPVFLFPHLILQFCCIPSGIALSILFGWEAHRLKTPLPWEMVLAFTVLAVYTVAEAYFAYVSVTCIRFIKKLKRAISLQEKLVKRSAKQLEGFVKFFTMAASKRDSNSSRNALPDTAANSVVSQQTTTTRSDAADASNKTIAMQRRLPPIATNSYCCTNHPAAEHSTSSSSSGVVSKRRNEDANSVKTSNNDENNNAVS